MDKTPELSGVLAVVDDLMFASRIDGLANQHGVSCVRVKSLAELEAVLATQPRALALVDLSLRGMDPVDVIIRIRKEQSWAKAAVLAYGSHVETEKLEAARAAGANGALPRSQFTQLLPDLIRTARGGDRG